ncbi:MAG: hypothetical protein J6D36_01700 [Erysipelotrichaceae bacterium]|nr:hypothetical protein [Erysipelotrichaceae bacterium]
MRYPLIKIRDKEWGHVRYVGEDSHDQLIFNNGHIEYINLQNGDGTPHGYEFVPEPADEYGIVPERFEFIDIPKPGTMTPEEQEEIDKKYNFWSSYVPIDQTKEEYEEFVKTVVGLNGRK